MNKILTISLILLIFGISVRDFVVYTHFKLDQDFIASVLCINKDKPAVKCEGKCYLEKKIEENHKEDSKVPLTNEERLTIHLYFAQKANYNSSTLNELSLIGYFKEFPTFSLTNKLLKPPQPSDLLS